MIVVEDKVTEVVEIISEGPQGPQGPQGPAGTGLTDGDKGDITVSASGTYWAIDNQAVSYAKIQNVSTTDRLLGRSSVGAGTVEEIACTSAGRALLDDVDAAAQRTTLGLGTLATQSGTFSGTSSGTNTGDQLLFQTIAVAGQSNVVADTTTDTLTLAAGTGISITTNAGTDTITITATGGGGGGSGDVVGPASSTDHAIARFDLATGKLIQNSAAILSDAGDIDTSSVTVDYVQIDTAATPAGAVGRTIWDDGNGTTALGLKGGNVTLCNGEQIYVRVYNDTASSMTKGQVVYLSGAQGNRVAVKLARADSELTSKDTIGFVAETIAAGAEGWVLHQGSLYNLDTFALTAGNTVYLSPTTAGAYTITKPSGPNHIVILGFVQRVSATVGSIYTKVDNGYELDELHNVSASSATSGNTLIYDAPAGLWKAANLTDGNSINIVEGDGTITISVADGDKGDITVSGSGASWTVDNQAITLAKQANVATGTVFYRKTAGTGSPEVQTLATLKTDLGLTGTNSGDQTITLTGNVTGSGTGSFATTIANSAVTYAKIQNVTASRLLGRAAGTNGVVEEVQLGTNLAFAGTTLSVINVQKTITSGTAAPSGGADGDIYLQYT